MRYLHDFYSYEAPTDKGVDAESRVPHRARLVEVTLRLKTADILNIGKLIRSTLIV